jgi:hypothetical protein
MMSDDAYDDVVRRTLHGDSDDCDDDPSAVLRRLVARVDALHQAIQRLTDAVNGRAQ